MTGIQGREKLLTSEMGSEGEKEKGPRSQNPF
jgi:hypothetical protein